MSASDHYPDCWRIHFACALARVGELERKVAQLENGVVEPTWMQRIRVPHGGMIPCGEDTQTGAFTHHVHLTLHRPGPTWSHHNDEPPTR